MLPRFSPRQPECVLSHWYAVAEGVRFSSEDFYGAVEDELASHQMPRMAKSRVEFHQGGAASDKRVYLRMARERYAFDLCAAPFGKDYFFSLRLVEKPRSWGRLLALLMLLWIAVVVMVQLHDTAPNLLWGTLLIVVIVGALFQGLRMYFRSALEASPSEMMPDFDTYILNLAVIGAVYEAIRKDTYYRQDTRLLYQALITAVVKRKVDEFTAEKGVRLIRTFDYDPVLRDLYKAEVKEPASEPVEV